MIKPKHLKKGDKVAIVSLSGGMLGEKWAIHKLEIAKSRLEKDFGLRVEVMPNALKGIEYLANHPEKRAEDLMKAFKDKSIKAIFNAIGGNDTIRLLPYIDFDVIKNNPKIFTGFSDTTVNHFMLQKAGVISYYGASVMNNFSEYVEINKYTLDAIKNTLFNPVKNLEIKPSELASYEKDKVWWSEENKNTKRTFHKDSRGYEVLQGKGKAVGRLLGGCIDTFPGFIGTSIWPKLSKWKNKILMIEMSEENMSPSLLETILHNLQAQGIFNVISGILVGKPPYEDKYEPYKETIKRVVGKEANRPDLPIMYNCNFGHAEPIGVWPLGAKCEMDLDNKRIVLLESATK